VATWTSTLMMPRTKTLPLVKAVVSYGFVNKSIPDQ